MNENNPIHIKLTYESLIALLQGKEFRLMTPDKHIIFHPPFDGVFMTHEQLDELRYQSQVDVFTLIQKLSDYRETAVSEDDKQ